LDWPDLARLPIPWLGNGNVTQDPDFPFAVRTRVLAYRNFAGLPFVVSAPPKACEAAAHIALKRFARPGGPAPWRLSDLPPRALRLLRERQMLPPRAAPFPGKKAFKYLAAAPDGAAWTLVNEVEHVTCGSLFPGRPSPEAFAAAYAPPEADARTRAPWAWSRSLGYLASDPARIGPGIAIELLVHLPGLALSRGLPQARSYLAATGVDFLPETDATVAAAAAPPAASPAEAGLFRLRSRGGLGKSPAQVYAFFSAAVQPVLDMEAGAQRRCMEKHHKRLEDRVRVSLQRLSDARTLDSAELLALGSMARLGSYLGMAMPQIPGILEALRVTTGAGHLAVSSGRDLSKEEEDILRANVVRSSMEMRSGEIH
jgi:protein-arginine kinase